MGRLGFVAELEPNELPMLERLFLEIIMLKKTNAKGYAEIQKWKQIVLCLE